MELRSGSVKKRPAAFNDLNNIKTIQTNTMTENDPSEYKYQDNPLIYSPGSNSFNSSYPLERTIEEDEDVFMNNTNCEQLPNDQSRQLLSNTINDIEASRLTYSGLKEIFFKSLIRIIEICHLDLNCWLSTWIIIKEYEGQESNELSASVNDRVVVLKEIGSQWKEVYHCQKKCEGLVPSAYLSNPSPFPILKYLAIPIVMALIFYFQQNISFSSAKSDGCLRSGNYSCMNLHIEELERNFPFFHEDTWITLTSCLDDALKDRKPCILLMMNDEDKDYSGFLQKVGDTSKQIMRIVRTDEVEHDGLIEIKGSNIYDSDHFFYNHKEMLKAKKVMIVDEMEKVPAKIMEQFHSLCDVYDPAVRQAVIIFLLNVKGINVKKESNDATHAINVLTELWKTSIHADIIDPLAIRVSENIIRLQKGLLTS